MNEIKKQLMAKIGDTTEKKYNVIKRVNESLDFKPQKGKKFAWSYYVTFASFVGIFILGLIFLPNLLNDQAALTEEDPAIVDPVIEPDSTEEDGYYDELKQFFPPNGTVATFTGGDFYSDGYKVGTNWITDRYVQEKIYANLKDCEACYSETPTKLYIYRITDEEIEMVYEGNQTEWTMEELEQLPTLTVKLKAPIEVGTEIEAQKIVSTNAELTTPYGTFSNAIVVEGGVDPSTPEIYSISYYVPNYGLVKHETEGFWHSELESISFGTEITEDESDYSDLLKSYFFPPEDLDLFFIGGFENGGVKVQTRWLSENFVQQISYNDGGTIERIYRITPYQIEMIHDNFIDGSKPSSMAISELKQLPTLEVVLKAPFTVGDVFGEWTLVDTNGQVSTLSGGYENVLVLETKSENYLASKYYAIGFGEVKTESMFYNEETGQYEEGITTELASFGQIMNEVVGNYLFRVFKEEQYNYNAIDEDENSPLNTKRAILHGRAGDFEGLNRLVIEDLQTGQFTIYKYRYEGEQNTPKDIEWIDENRLYVIIGFAYGTVTKGGSLYILNVEDHSITPVFENIFENDGREEFMSIEANGDGTFTYKKHIYDDAEFNVGHVEEGTLSPP